MNHPTIKPAVLSAAAVVLCVLSLWWKRYLDANYEHRQLQQCEAVCNGPVRGATYVSCRCKDGRLLAKGSARCLDNCK